MNRRSFLGSALAALATLPFGSLTALAATPQFGSRQLYRGVSGADVQQLQGYLKEMGYFAEEPTGYFGAITFDALKQFQAYRDLIIDGVAGPQTFKALRPQMLDWFDRGTYLLPVGRTAKVTDPITGLSYRVKRTGGVKHADVEPVTAWDTSVMKRIYGGVWSWNRKPVIVTIKGWRIAASINGMPHGYDTIATNQMQGQTCIHFLNSRTHEGNRLDPDHQSAVRKAATFM
ncbi:peptidoglycan binding domain 1, putative [Heliomicrobium modesticaldum Ice1]|uniref:Peptidoglycan binding domain 1, putative n=1 Tax=Heliobacterium modesticaldum (strain ATCC 51547 / Ice1) TaxID=498761 RepID=B0TE60_HELMI|nr:peptidoglycan-binding domain-containing protein [Heliomicrobium modesticaldum]ABZ84255.1 peptidoglycan binding domain 1, putative [Heliomicrobium modesticaldum Ice1]